MYLGIDIGTTAVKAVLFDGDGRELGAGLAEYTLLTPGPDVVELNPAEYTAAARRAAEAALAASKRPPEEIRGVGITGQAETLICVDQSGRALGNAIVWLDNRAKAEAAELEARFGIAELCRISGQTEMLPCWPAAKIRWLAKHDPERFRKTAGFLMVEDFLAWELTRNFATCRGLMPSSLYYDLSSGEYYPAMLEALEIDSGRLPRLLEPGECAGVTVSGGFLPPGIPVTICPLDHVCGCLGSGGGDGVVTETTGCTLALCAPLPGLIYDPERRLGTYHGYLPGSFVFLPWAPTAGMLLRYFRDRFAPDLGYADLDRIAAGVPPGAEGLVMLPHCAGAVSPVVNPAARGVVYGVTLAHGREHFARAVMESVACLLNDNLLALEEMGVKISELRSLGGAARSRLWLQIKADILNKPVTTLESTEATSLGAAILAAVAARDVASATDGASRMVRIGERVEPDPAHAGAYRGLWEKYKELNKLLMPTFGG